MVVKRNALAEVLGPVSSFGKYQIWQYWLALIPVVATAMSNTNYVFSAAAVPYRCVVPRCEDSAASITRPPWWPPYLDTRCVRPLWTSNRTACKLAGFSNQSQPCDQWVYENNNSIVAEFNLACQEWKRTLVGTAHNIGVLLSMPLNGYISDKWGRRTAIIFSTVGLITGSFKVLAVSLGAGYQGYMILEVLEAAVVTGTYTSSFVFMLELVGSDKRVFSSAALGFAIASGELCLALTVWLVPNWKYFQLIIYCPAALFLSYIFLLDESIRWLITNGKKDKVLTLMEKMARWNGFVLSDKVVEEIKDSNITADEEQGMEKFHPRLLFSSTILLKRLLICSWWWFATAFVFYGLIINSVALPGNKLTNFVLSSVATIPGDLTAMFAQDRIGRKKTLFGGFLFCGICCVANGFVPKDAHTAQIAVFLLGKVGIAVCFNTIYVYTSELMPTSARSWLVGTCSMLARFGSILAPLTPLLSVYWRCLPTTLFGLTALGAAALALGTPETLRRDLPDTVAQAELM